MGLRRGELVMGLVKHANSLGQAIGAEANSHMS